jgi:hypothetical protein
VSHGSAARRPKAETTKFPVTDVSSGAQTTDKPAEVPRTNLNRIWPMLVVIAGVLISLAWTGFLAWAAVRMLGVL